MIDGELNRIHNAGNPYQGSYKRVLCVCSAGLLRSPTVAWVLSQHPYNFNTRAAGIDAGHALIKVDTILMSWADEIVIVETRMEETIKELGKGIPGFAAKPIICLNIKDSFAYRDPELIRQIRENYEAWTKAPSY